MQKYIFILFFTFHVFSISAQFDKTEYDLAFPLNIPVELSGNFGELRSNHFHAGIDFKTQQVIDKPVFSVADGYVSRFGVSPTGYGHVLYITHYNGLTSVYAHLDSFVPFLDSIVQAKQHEERSFAVDFTLPKDMIKVKRLQQVGWSGNTGSSGGPHLHFELRDTYTEEALNPFLFYDIEDTVRPRVHKFLLYPSSNEGVVEGSMRRRTMVLEQTKPGFYRHKGNVTIKAWGKVGLGVHSYDYMPNANNIYGVHSVRVLVDGAEIFVYQMDRFSFDKTRYMNAFIDYEEWYTNRSMVMTLFRLPNNKLDNYVKLVNDGYLLINEERIYPVQLIIKDFHGNTTTLDFSIQGVKQEIPKVEHPNAVAFSYDKENVFENADVKLTIPAGALYQNMLFNYSVRYNPKGFSDVHDLHLPTIPLHDYAELRIKLKNDSLSDKNKYYIARKNRLNGFDFVGNGYEDGCVVTKTRDFGQYAVLLDNEAPIIRLATVNNGHVIFKVSDNQSGVSHYNGYVDNEWALFKYDKKTNTITHKFDSKRVEKGGIHHIELRVFDKCGNEAVYQNQVWW